MNAKSFRGLAFALSCCVLGCGEERTGATDGPPPTTADAARPTDGPQPTVDRGPADSGPTDGGLMDAAQASEDAGGPDDAMPAMDAMAEMDAMMPAPQVSSENGVSTIHDGQCLAEVFVSDSIPESYRDRVQQGYETACRALGDVRPLEIWVTANIEAEAADLRARWCARRLEVDPGFRAEWCSRSQLGVGLANYVHWSAVYYRGLTRGHHQLNLSMFSNDPHDLSAEYVTMHEFFHSYQFAHLDQATFSSPESRDVNLGRTATADRPWHTEGSANFVSWQLTEEHFQSGFLRRELGHVLDRCAEVIDADFDVTTLTYEDACGYGLGTWAIAYLTSVHGLQTYLDFYDAIDGDGYYAAFEASFGETEAAFSRAFTDWFLRTPRGEKLSLFE